jgi:hypothetical protein
VRGCINTGLFSFASFALGLSMDMRLKSLFLFEGDFCATDGANSASSSGMEEVSDQRDPLGGTQSLSWSRSREGKAWWRLSALAAPLSAPLLVTTAGTVQLESGVKYADEVGDAGPDDSVKSDSGNEVEREWGSC